MKKTIFRISLIYACILLLLCAGCYFSFASLDQSERLGRELVLINEIRQLSKDAEGVIPAGQTIDQLEESIRQQNIRENKDFLMRFVGIFFVVGLLYTVTLFAYIYRKMLQPFDKLRKYAQEIAAGNLDVQLDYERTNYFGAFTWAFDHMRKEIGYARNKEREAIEANKTIIASLSHDIKTPIASIRAYSEALEANLDAQYERRERYVATIMRKCDEVTALVNDLVLHSLSELEKLEITMTEISLDQVIRQTVEELEFEQLMLEEPLPQMTVCGDAKRIAQILENLINNARKYAPGKPVRIYCEEKEDRFHVHVRDYGEGVAPEDLPFVTQKFYRGKNVGDMPGSGLGLYIVDYILKAMNGGLAVQNTEQGLDVDFYLLKTS